jgi:hypothetical protein
VRLTLGRVLDVALNVVVTAAAIVFVAGGHFIACGGLLLLLALRLLNAWRKLALPAAPQPDGVMGVLEKALIFGGVPIAFALAITVLPRDEGWLYLLLGSLFLADALIHTWYQLRWRRRALLSRPTTHH